jgi:hypothetical protein
MAIKLRARFAQIWATGVAGMVILHATSAISCRTVYPTYLIAPTPNTADGSKRRVRIYAYHPPKTRLRLNPTPTPGCALRAPSWRRALLAHPRDGRCPPGGRQSRRKPHSRGGSSSAARQAASASRAAASPNAPPASGGRGRSERRVGDNPPIPRYRTRGGLSPTLHPLTRAAADPPPPARPLPLRGPLPRPGRRPLPRAGGAACADASSASGAPSGAQGGCG